MIMKSTWCSNTRLNPCGGRRRRSPSTALITGFTCPGRCEAKNIELSDTLERSRNSVLVAQVAKNLPADQQQIPAKESTSESQLVPAVATNTIVLRDDEPHKTTVIGASLNSA